MAEVGPWARAGLSAHLLPSLLPLSPHPCPFLRSGLRHLVNGSREVTCERPSLVLGLEELRMCNASCSLAASRTCGPSKGSAFFWIPCCQSCLCFQPRQICMTTHCTGPVTSSYRTRWGRRVGRGRTRGRDGPGPRAPAPRSAPQASCLPAMLLAPPPGSHVIDACAARQQDQSLGCSSQEPGVSAVGSQKGMGSEQVGNSVPVGHEG